MSYRLARVLALAVLSACALAAHAADPAGSNDDIPMPNVPAMPSGPPAGVRKITDGALSCEQIFAESGALEKSISAHKAASDTAQKEANQQQEAMMASAMSMPGGGVAGTAANMALGFVPGGSMVSSLAMQAAMEARMSATRDSTSKMTAAYQKMAQSQQDLQYAQARNDHLIDMFLRKNCRLPGATP